ncbi:MAG: glycoside hydrolase family 31 [Myxococcales bacterium]|nr:glycoside hydrolase family 31 [Myxococcales bacterium]
MLRALAVIFLIAGWCAPAHALTPGNAWHVPTGAEPGIATMRSPVHGITAGTDVQVYSGNQFAGTGGTPGNQLQTGSAVLFRRISDTAWTTVPMTFVSQSGNNKYFVATIPGNALRSGDVIEYYLRIAYSDHATTFIYGNDATSHATIDEPTAQAAPYAFGVDWPLDPAGSFISHNDGAWESRIYSDSGHIALVGPGTGATPLQINLAPPSAKIDGNWLPIGRVISQSSLGNGLELQQALGRQMITAQLTFSSTGVLRYEVVNWGGAAPTETQIAAASDSTEHFYGFGEKFNSLDQAGKIVHVITSDTAGDKGDHSYMVAPWFMSSRGYGFHLDSTAESDFDMRASAPDRFVAHLAFHTLAVNLVGGPSLRDVLTRYTGYAGRPALPPPWVFGPWISSDAWRDGGEVRYVVGKLLAQKIPGSVFVFDSPWEIAYNDFAWNMTQFSAGGTYEGQLYPGFTSSAEMMAFLKHNGFKVVVWLTPFINVRSNDEWIAGQNLGRAAIYDTAAANGYFVRSSPNGAPLVTTWWKGDGSPVDFTNPAARSWFTTQLQLLVDASGGAIAGFKTDDGEADYIPLTASYHDGRNGSEMRNGYCVEYLKTVWSVLGLDGIVFARSGFTGTQSFPALWAGDNEPNFGAGNGLPSVVQAGLSSAMSGYSTWGSDIGGYQDRNASATPEDLFMRWTQFGALSPVMQMHRQITAGLQYPWSYGQVALDNYRAYAQLHTALFPYLYTYAKQASMDGIPLIRPLPLIDSSDPNALASSDEYGLGGDLLVAPVLTANATTRAVYLPAGGWFDYWTSSHVAGGASVSWSGTATQLPLYVREGAIIPRISPDVQSLADASYVGNSEIKTPDGSLDFLIYPSATSHVVVYDGTDITCDASTHTTTISVTSIARMVTFEVYSSAHPVSVTRDGTALAEAAPADLATAAEGWAYDGTFVQIKIAHAGNSTTLVLSGTAGPVDPMPGDAGCGCRTGGGGRAAGCLLLIALAGLMLVRRSR